MSSPDQRQGFGATVYTVIGSFIGGAAGGAWQRRFCEIPSRANTQLIRILKSELAEPFSQCVAGDVTCEEIANQARPLLNGVEISDEHLLLGVELWSEDERG